MSIERLSPKSRIHHLWAVLIVSIWFGLIAGLLEGIAKVVFRSMSGKVIQTSESILWIAPVFYLLFFLLIGLSLFVLFQILRRQVDLRLLVGLYIWIIGFGVLLFVGGLSQWAGLLLSLGAGVEAGRRFGKASSRMQNFFRASLPWMAAATLVLGLVGGFWSSVREANLVRRLPSASSQAPNVILITLDTVRADHLSSYGYPRPTTPNLDRIAAQGVAFEAAFSNSSWTLPAHASMFTGRQPFEHQANWQTPMSDQYPVLAEALYARGYQTAAFAANSQYIAPEWGLGRGFTHFEVYGNSLIEDFYRTIYGRKLALNILPRLGFYDIPGRKNAADVNNEFLGWLNGLNNNNRPFFAFLNYFDAHDPYLAESPFDVQYSPQPLKGDVINFQFQVPFRRKAVLNPAEIQQEIDGYDGTLAYMDARLGELFSDLTKRGLDQNTLIIIASDHGESFGSHNLFGHGNGLYLDSLHVPLLFYWPGKIPAGVRPAEVVGLNHLPATVMDLLGAPQSPFPGRSLAVLWSAEDAGKGWDEPVLAELSSGRFDDSPVHYPNSNQSLQALITHDWHLIQPDSGQEELFAWQEDRSEEHNLAMTAEGQEVVKQLEQQLRAMKAGFASSIVGNQHP